MNAADYQVGERVHLISHHGVPYPAEVVGHTALDCDLVVKWLAIAPFLAGERSTVCLKELKEVRRVDG